MLAAEGLCPVPDPGEPSAILCQAARTAIRAWRQPAGTSAERDITVEQLITTVGFLAAATRRLTADAPRRIIGLSEVAASLTRATARLSRALPANASAPAAQAPSRAATRRPGRSAADARRS